MMFIMTRFIHTPRACLSAIPEPDPEFEKNRIHVDYDPSAGIRMDKSVKCDEITPGHFVLATEEEAAAYRAERNK
jgi:oligopeptide transport system ATP-binding protein